VFSSYVGYRTTDKVQSPINSKCIVFSVRKRLQNEGSAEYDTKDPVIAPYGCDPRPFLGMRVYKLGVSDIRSYDPLCMTSRSVWEGGGTSREAEPHESFGLR
jgi:hypothetical protein